ncbi:hypothetical protein [Nonomuraea gerenzanensis]|uniref:N-acetylmuramoyl-L-alanine amidase n=1 Tax=Nonomuraea gerenzanensis TaxID=93944 RepID=A0A1M4EKV7_9ACTN|nr:hypothetical protein [Nonomuraea gerenzanensis]UBU10990.1 hypothetical protein LCN96_42770 [Nonomuraea gerenzanensis]SBO99444.1 N-acetylmuramoyl-L-alanine amidase [Nonomuraea gerenzanensis]
MLIRSLMAATLVAAGIAALPSAAYAASAAYTPERVCGKGFHRVKDGHRAMRTRSGAVFGHVYLMYNKRSGKNCVAAIKTRFTGTRTVTGAYLEVRGGGRSEDAQRYQFYAETGHIDGAWKCVKYEGWTRDPDNRVTAWGGRKSWGNCDG